MFARQTEKLIYFPAVSDVRTAARTGSRILKMKVRGYSEVVECMQVSCPTSHEALSC